MVAYGVLELKQRHTPSIRNDFLSGEEVARIHKIDFEAEQLRKLVNDELKRYGLLLSRAIKKSLDGGYRTSHNSHVLYGQKTGPKGFEVRPLMCEGNFKECCTAAAEALDILDASQIPDTAAG